MQSHTHTHTQRHPFSTNLTRCKRRRKGGRQGGINAFWVNWTSQYRTWIIMQVTPCIDRLQPGPPSMSTRGKLQTTLCITGTSLRLLTHKHRPTHKMNRRRHGCMFNYTHAALIYANSPGGAAREAKFSRASTPDAWQSRRLCIYRLVNRIEMRV